MMEVRIETGAARDKWVGDHFLLALFEFSDEEMTVSLGPEYPESSRITSQLWSHTVWELENFAVGLRFVASGGLPEYFKVPSKDMLIGPTVHLWPALQFQMGHPGIGVEGDRTNFYCSIRWHPLAKRNLVYLEALNIHGSVHTEFEVDDVLRISDGLYDKAKDLEPTLVGRFDPDNLDL